MANDKAYNVQGLMVFTLDLFIIGDCQDDPILPTNQYSLIAVRARLVLIFCQLYANLLNKQAHMRLDLHRCHFQLNNTNRTTGIT
jgi:hypothetical protein